MSCCCVPSINILFTSAYYDIQAFPNFKGGINGAGNIWPDDQDFGTTDYIPYAVLSFSASGSGDYHSESTNSTNDLTSTMSYTSIGSLSYKTSISLNGEAVQASTQIVTGNYEAEYTRIVVDHGVTTTTSDSSDYPNPYLENARASANFPSFVWSNLGVVTTDTSSPTNNHRTQIANYTAGDTTNVVDLVQDATWSSPITPADMIAEFMAVADTQEIDLTEDSIGSLDIAKDTLLAIVSWDNSNCATDYARSFSVDSYNLFFGIFGYVKHMGVKYQIWETPEYAESPDEGTMIGEYTKILNVKFWKPEYTSLEENQHISDSLEVNKSIMDSISYDADNLIKWYWLRILKVKYYPYDIVV